MDPIKQETLDEALKCRKAIMSSPIGESSFQGHTYKMQDLEKLDRAIRKLEDELADAGGGPGGPNRKLVYTKFRRI